MKGFIPFGGKTRIHIIFEGLFTQHSICECVTYKIKILFFGYDIV